MKVKTQLKSGKMQISDIKPYSTRFYMVHRYYTKSEEVICPKCKGKHKVKVGNIMYRCGNYGCQNGKIRTDGLTYRVFPFVIEGFDIRIDAKNKHLAYVCKNSLHCGPKYVDVKPDYINYTGKKRKSETTRYAFTKKSDAEKWAKECNK